MKYHPGDFAYTSMDNKTIKFLWHALEKYNAIFFTRKTNKQNLLPVISH